MEKVSIVVPCYNEESTIQFLLEAILRQTYPLEYLEVVLADGMSTDQTRARVESFKFEHPRLAIQVIDNPQRIIPAALNRAIRASIGDIIVRLDAHSIPDDTFVERCVADLAAGKGDNVGGIWLVTAGRDTWMAKAIAAAAAHPLGVGDALYRFTDKAAEVDTVPFGSFYRSTFDRIGFFDESLLTNEDYEYNTRLRQHGGKVWLNPQIRSVYFARPDLTSLARQYWRYGYWKWQMLRRYPKTVRWRQALPPLFVLSIIGLIVLSFWKPARWLLLVELTIYFLILAAAAFPVAWKNKDLRIWPGFALAIACMHLSWGSGFLWSALTSIFQPKN
jgi:glycosyltransferase involved in cell wall biosynthesis